MILIGLGLAFWAVTIALALRLAGDERFIFGSGLSLVPQITHWIGAAVALVCFAVAL